MCSILRQFDGITKDDEGDFQSVTRVCLIGEQGLNLREELLSRETSREALATYELEEPFVNSIAIKTVSLGAAVAFLNDLNWYVVRFVADAFVQAPSVSESEWLSRPLAENIRNAKIQSEETGRYLKIYGLENGALVEPLYVMRESESIPDYDLRPVEETVIIRLTSDEFGH